MDFLCRDSRTARGSMPKGFSLQFTRRYCMGHRLLSGLAPKCAFPHGHNEFVRVRLAPRLRSALDGTTNMVEEFGAVKKLWHRWIDEAVDHSFQLSENDPLVQYFIENEPAAIPHLLITPGDPTTECLAACFSEKLRAFLRLEESELDIVSVTIMETPTNSVTLHGSSIGILPPMPSIPWWCRADMSINDLGVAAPLQMEIAGAGRAL
jgi:6-pyruvoyltetrahydropterin/6-carboxytetrahydropterin synthase